MVSWQKFLPKLEAEGEPGEGGDHGLTLAESEQFLLHDLEEDGDFGLEQEGRCRCSGR